MTNINIIKKPTTNSNTNQFSINKFTNIGFWYLLELVRRLADWRLIYFDIYYEKDI